MIRLRTYLLQRQVLLWTIVLLSGGLSVWTMVNNAAATQDVAETQQELAQIQATLVTVLNLETGIRGYAITGERPFLEPYNAARTTMDAQLQTLRRSQYEHVDPGSSGQLGRVARIETLLGQWYRDIADYAVANRTAQPQRVVVREKSGLGKQLIDAIRQEIQAYTTAEQRELRVRQTEVARARWINQVVTVVGVLAAILTSVLSSLLVAQTLSRKLHRFAEAAARLAATEQPSLLGEFRILEVRRLAASFNAMSVRLSESHTALVEQNAALQDRNVEVVTSNTLATQLQTCLGLEEGQVVLQHALPQVFPSLSGTLSILNSSKNLLDVQAQWGGTRRGETLTFEPSQCLAVRRGQRYDPKEEPLGLPCPLMQEAHLCFPLLAQGEALGHLRLWGLPEEPALQARIRSLATTVANQSALGLSNLRLRETLRQQSIRDPLTGLFNRRYLDETFERELRRAVRHGQPLSVLMLDVDHFKRFNDTYGHEAGDQVLIELGQLLRKQFRTEDVVCRYGGEEFAVVLPGADLTAAHERAEGLRQAVSRLSVEHGGETVGAISLSIGVSAYPVHGEDTGHLLGLADQALYRAKQMGRDRVMVADS
ncbi:sensor domain-containing diguanylate cyclase [Deinococcus hopiensis]|uniref:Diguanylate cyclase (GGDEF) domain-containing protein n=1 Tax=Deinococcus hopiensis KR-140 TaxID=695939 RepID=A0A1W1UQR1_9DEIO|nr:GGDEF domain-containing protein [Deinococcus hopiensis]SMB83396.1 diguanylate cyclase (GGDEF) domain-containing protein [Deinococcus hopiensis KR-140]